MKYKIIGKKDKVLGEVLWYNVSWQYGGIQREPILPKSLKETKTTGTIKNSVQPVHKPPYREETLKRLYIIFRIHPLLLFAIHGKRGGV